MNQVALVGRMTKDPFLREVAPGRMQTTFVLAVNRHFKNASGEVDSDFILCSLWGRLAENTAKYCGKGSLIAVSGRIQSRSFQREDATRVYVTEVVGDKVQFLDTKSRSSKETTLSARKENKESETNHFVLPKREDNDLPIT